jgi:hypothetical protein
LVPKGNCFVIEIIYDESKVEKEGAAFFSKNIEKQALIYVLTILSQ